MKTITKKETKPKTKSTNINPYRLILFNDNFNTFDWVITCLIKICGHEREQAEQCAYIIHFKGKCDVKYGDFESLSSMKKKLIDSGLSVTIEST